MGNNISDAFGSGIKQGVIGGVSGALFGGILAGIQSVRNKMDFWDGDIPLKERLKIITNDIIPDDVLRQAGEPEFQLGKNMGDANGTTLRGDYCINENGEGAFQHNKIALSRMTVKRIWYDKIQGIETLNHELGHSVDYRSGEYFKILNANSRSWPKTSAIMEMRAFMASYFRTGNTDYLSSYKYWEEILLNLNSIK